MGERNLSHALFFLLFRNRNPHFRIILFIKRSVRVLFRVVVHFNAVTCRYFVVLARREPLRKNVFVLSCF